MKPIGPLMREHRLIERMVSLLNAGLKQMTEENKANVELLAAGTDFFRTYADRTHHGKEEDILFRDLARKKLSPEHTKTMNELLEEHVHGRKMVSTLASARKAYIDGDKESLKEIIACVSELVRFYPAHIEKEDKHFFYPILDYLSKEEQDAMQEEFWEFDKKLIHEKYHGIVEEMEKSKG